MTRLTTARALAWALGFGYTSGWQTVHRAEEALLLVLPLSQVIDEAETDRLRLRDSGIDNRAVLLDSLDKAVLVLTITGGPLQPAELRARQTVRRVRQAINEFRDERREGLVRARNGLLRSVLLTWMIVFALLALGAIASVDRGLVRAAAVDFLLGAIVGMFNRLYLDAQAETAVEDFGLATARLIHTPLFSGLAGLGGVFIIPMLAVLATGGSAAAATQSGSLLPTPAELFNWTSYPFGAVLAIIFGLSPTALLNRLQQEAEQYKSDLKRSS